MARSKAPLACSDSEDWKKAKRLAHLFGEIGELTKVKSRTVQFHSQESFFWPPWENGCFLRRECVKRMELESSPKSEEVPAKANGLWACKYEVRKNATTQHPENPSARLMNATYGRFTQPATSALGMGCLLCSRLGGGRLEKPPPAFLPTNARPSLLW